MHGLYTVLYKQLFFLFKQALNANSQTAVPTCVLM